MQTPFTYGGCYGWAQLPPVTLAHSIKKGAADIVRLRKKVPFDAVAFSGSSGAAIAFYLAVQYQIPLIYVRKKNEQSHGQDVECNLINSTIDTYLIVDDFIDTGKTVDFIINRIARAAKKRGVEPLTPVGIFCYDAGMTPGVYEGIPIYVRK